jgi:hypothetical protein
MRLLPLGLLVSAALACDDAPPAAVPPVDVPAVDAAVDVPAADAPAADAPEAAVDAPAIEVTAAPPRTCRPCRADAECGDDGSVCVAVDAARAPGLRECRLVCPVAGERCAAAVPATCRDDAAGNRVCTPDAPAGCVPMESRRGAACPTGGCLGRYDRCVDLDATRPSVGRAGDVCLGACVTDADCEDGARRCRDLRTPGGEAVRACVPDDRIGPDACGNGAIDARGINAPCGGDAGVACPTGLRCVTPSSPLLRGFCTAACASNADCGEGARCDAGQQVCVPDGCRCGFEPREQVIDLALRADPAAPWDRCSLFFSAATLDAFGAFVTRDRFRLPVFDRVHRDWLAGARWARGLGVGIDGEGSTLSGAIRAAAGMRLTGDVYALPAPIPAPAASGDAPLVDAVEAWATRGGGAFDRAAAVADAADVPTALQAAVARVLRAALTAADARDRGLSRFPTDDERAHLFRIAPHLVLPTNRADERASFANPEDLAVVLGEVTLPAREAADLAATVEAVDWRPFAGAMGASFRVETPAGQVVIRDGAAHRHGPELRRTLLMLDLGGDDTYTAPVGATLDAAQPVSVAIDLGGDDTYGYVEAPGALDTPETLPSDADGRSRAGGAVAASMSRTGTAGSGRLGVGLLYDLGGGSDRYRALRMSQGFGALGVGGLFDDGGDDTYAIESGGQGAAVVGIGVLVDGAGRDAYSAWAFAQGFGYVQGVGMLHDRAGDDTYLSRVTPVIHPSPQSPMSNSSFTQGAGFGRRGDATPDRTNMSGGIGVLRDRGGADRYTAGVFAQGTGYWGGMGLLLDAAGDDRYDARWYVQGAAAHFAFGALVDGGGVDVHNQDSARENMTAGAGHDFSLGILLALGDGADTYHVPNLALGAGNANGAGLFADEGGDDTYDAAAVLSLGNAALESLTDMGRLARPTAGIFLDGGGRDAYRQGALTTLAPANDRTWSQRVHPEAPSERGFGADVAASPQGLW